MKNANSQSFHPHSKSLSLNTGKRFEARSLTVIKFNQQLPVFRMVVVLMSSQNKKAKQNPQRGLWKPQRPPIYYGTGFHGLRLVSDGSYYVSWEIGTTGDIVLAILGNIFHIQAEEKPSVQFLTADVPRSSQSCSLGTTIQKYTKFEHAGFFGGF